MDKTASSGLISTTELVLSVVVVIIVMMFISNCISRRMRGVRHGYVHHDRQNYMVTTDASELGQTGVAEDSFVATVIEEATLERFPRLLYSDQAKTRNELGNYSCSVCLADYKESDMLRLLPDCGHVFHLKCVDSWLRLRPTRPFCRTLPNIGIASPPRDAAAACLPVPPV